MCGICGVIGIEPKERSEAVVRRMMAAMVHRGPDDEGILSAPPVTAGMRRLSVIDISGGTQPVFNAAGTLAVLFNGEIYNFRELRRVLEGLGREFHTRSDTEVIVNAYEEWGEDCVSRLNGMFSFVIVEIAKNSAGRATRIFLARDRLGIKPLYYALENGALFFASEVRALLATGYIAARLSSSAIPAYLLFGSAGEPGTLVDEIHSLPPGHVMGISVDGPLRLPTPKAYWDFRTATGDPDSKPASGAPLSHARQVRSLLENAVTSHLIADVPVGVFLSSGLDSTAIAALANRVHGGMHTFTVTFPGTEFDEGPIARRTAKQLGTRHSELALSEQDIIGSLDSAVASFDQPSMDGINTYFVSQAARSAGLKVALSGLGSDEIFGGYSSFRDTSKVALLAALARCVPGPARCLAANLSECARTARSSQDKFQKAAAAWMKPNLLPHPYFYTRLLFSPLKVGPYLRESSSSWKSMLWWQWLSESAAQSKTADRFMQISWLELRSYLVNTLLRDTDSVSMRHSLEVRVPFLDSSLVKYVLALPEQVKAPQGRPKALLIGALGDLLPKEIVAQRKRTFTFPWQNWLRGELGDRVAAGLQDWSPVLETVIGGDFARRVWNDFRESRTSWSRPWSLFVLNEWVKRHIDSGATSRAVDPESSIVVSAPAA